ncbi:MAG: hypothetical protein JXR26_06395 [Balneolaceae bacterium]|nr:hypothetical protein [Balneolaceae bacterium]
MTYPIFNSFINQIENELNSKDIKITSLKTWNEDRINATGLQINIDVSSQNNFIKEVSINFDWDRFRETVLAQQLKGLQEHPMLQEKNLKSITIQPKIDVEISWIFDEKKHQIALPDDSEKKRLDAASEWMQEISKQVNELLSDDNIITRWHIEVEGNHKGKRLTSVSLISYFQYSLTDLKSLNEVHDFINEQLHDLLIKSKKVRQISDNTLEVAA